MSHANCDTCGSDYDFTPQTARIHVYYDDSRYNHLAAKCLKGHDERFYFAKEDFFGLLGMGLNLPMTWWQSVQINVQEGYERMFGAPEPKGKYDDLPQAPRDWLTQLYNDMRNFGDPRTA